MSSFYAESRNLPTAETPTVTVDLPQYFLLDYADRIGLGARGRLEVVKVLSRKVRVRLDLDAFHDIAGDAAWYVDPWGPQLDFSQLGIIHSARATLKALKAVPPPAPGPHPLGVDRLEAPESLLE